MRLSVLLFGLVALAAAPVSSVYAHEDLDDLAEDVQEQAGDLIKEFQAHYSHTPNYEHLINDARQMYGLSARIHRMIEKGSRPHQLRREVEQLDGLFHHLQEQVAITEQAARRGVGHKHGNSRHVARAMKQMERDLHEMQAVINPAPLRPPVYNRGPIGRDHQYEDRYPNLPGTRPYPAYPSYPETRPTYPPYSEVRPYPAIPETRSYPSRTYPNPTYPVLPAPTFPVSPRRDF